MTRPGWMTGHCKKKIATRSLLIEHLLCAQHQSALTFQDCVLPERIFSFVTRCCCDKLFTLERQTHFKTLGYHLIHCSVF